MHLLIRSNACSFLACSGRRPIQLHCYSSTIPLRQEWPPNAKAIWSFTHREAPSLQAPKKDSKSISHAAMHAFFIPFTMNGNAVAVPLTYYLNLNHFFPHSLLNSEWIMSVRPKQTNDFQFMKKLL